ncbi:dienelactone hydrolase [Rhypophila decipiens]|uniref:Dienelactone hydrolase n=1 Tax=Rhypophila decipiens TaxID=261697 RepID=A0AAN6YF23_9PEZI|nr:dienelactone hydrolase [Rhypophila decipiens]
MNVDVPSVIKAALPKESRNKNVAILKDNWTGTMNHNDPGFLSDDFPRNPPKLYIAGEDDDFDADTLMAWRAEGFDVEYLSLGAGFMHTLGALHQKRKLGPCETFGIVAYGKAASLCLEHYHVLDNNTELKLGCLIAYYPTRIPDPNTRFPSAIRVLVHLPVGQVKVLKQTQMVGIQGKKRTTKLTVDGGVGVGGLLPAGYPCYSYGAPAGFAEHDLDEYDGICAELAWSRSIATARRAFRMDSPSGVEATVERSAHAKFHSRSAKQLLSTFTAHDAPQVTHVPTLSGALGRQELQDFYSDYFLGDNPPSMKVTLLSRTIGLDRVVDEMFVSFKHTQDMPWILPGVPPTKKRVEIIIVSIVTLRGGKLHHERVYWDQASVLAQIGLLDPKLVPQAAQERGVRQLPVVGGKAARRVFSGGEDSDEGEADNELIRDWEDEDDEEEEDENESDEEEEEEEEEEVVGEDVDENGVENGADDEVKSGAGKLSLDGEPALPRKGKANGS